MVSMPGGRNRSAKKRSEGRAQLAVVQLLARERSDDLSLREIATASPWSRGAGGGAFGNGGAAAGVDVFISAPRHRLAGSGERER
jgi:hypothetical protein